MESIRPLLGDAASRGADYLESLAARPVYPREADIGRLRDALAGELPDAPTPDAEVLTLRAILDAINVQ